MKLFRQLIWFAIVGVVAGAGLLITGAATTVKMGQGKIPDQQPQSQDERPPQAGTIQVRVRLVPVDVTVTDRNDQPVTDLRKEEFHVFENGREQEIRHFTMQTFADAPAAPAVSAIPQQAPQPADLAPQTARTFLILMGRGRHHRFKNLESLVRWVRGDLLPADRVAVFAYNRATAFTTDHEQIAHVLERYKSVYQTVESRLESLSTGLTAIYGSKSIPQSLQSTIDQIFANPNAPAGRQVPADLSETAQSKRDNSKAGQILTHQLVKQLADAVSDPGGSIAATPNEIMAMDMVTGMIPLDDWAVLNSGTAQDMKNILTCLEYLRLLEGEKHLLFFSEQGLYFPFGNVDNDETIARVANNARVAIDTFQTGGIPFDMGISKGPVNLTNISLSNPGQIDAISALKSIAQLTGGRTSIYGYLSPALNRVNESSRIEYLLGYYPKDEDWNGEYRRIDVKVSRPGVKVSFRRGYFARDTFGPSDMREYLAYSRITSAGGYEAEISDIPFKVDVAKPLAPGGQAQINVALQIDAKRLGFRSVDGRHTDRLRIVIYYADGRRNYLGEEWKNLDLRLLEDTYQRFLQSGIPISIPIPFRARNQILKIVIYDMQGDLVGSKVIKIK